jgi:hypothetical protein
MGFSKNHFEALKRIKACLAVYKGQSSTIQVNYEDLACIDEVVDQLLKELPQLNQPKTGGNEVDHPKHYNAGRFEVIDVIEDWKLGFNDGNALKYIGRHKHKGNPLEDLKKGRWYLDREISRLEEAEGK